jgi:hypothetical protein
VLECIPIALSAPLFKSKSREDRSSRQTQHRDMERDAWARKFCQINFQNICQLAHDLQAGQRPPPSPAYC